MFAAETELSVDQHEEVDLISSSLDLTSSQLACYESVIPATAAAEPVINTSDDFHSVNWSVLQCLLVTT